MDAARGDAGNVEYFAERLRGSSTRPSAVLIKQTGATADPSDLPTEPRARWGPRLAVHARLRGPVLQAKNDDQRPRRPGPPVDVDETEVAGLDENEDCTTTESLTVAPTFAAIHPNGVSWSHGGRAGQGAVKEPKKERAPTGPSSPTPQRQAVGAALCCCEVRAFAGIACVMASCNMLDTMPDASRSCCSCACA